MTREEIEVLKAILDEALSYDEDEICLTYDEAVLLIDFFDKLLEREPILDKIRAEVKALPNANPSYSGYIDVVDREDVLEIIDKYKAESEE